MNYLITRDDLMTIARRDPDGWETREPTDLDRALFKGWVIESYGYAAWDRYHEVWGWGL